ncbi:MAG: response regulator transcription factor [Verrucomicrobia bacterium]|nr:response regulator transcription factor [Verrucomicrobiota bacterium]MBV9276132.1 response regulator transcription factor [Verrucomicrobiota bacterium]
MRDTILVVDDEPDVVDLVRYHLHRSGFEVWVALTGASGLNVARERRPDAIVLDIMLPHMTGIEVLKALRTATETASIPVVMLTAKTELSERIVGLELGVDDYITKPFSPRELVLRIQNLLRRLRTVHASSVLTVDDFQLDKNNFEVTVCGRRLDLTTTEFKLLAVLLERRGRTLSRQTLLQDVWGYENLIDTRTVDTHVRRLREKLGEAAHRIVTIRGEGYRFLANQTP